jgi:1-acyl-sn-glycerol-3-phosphate acyltransferase
MNYLRSALLWIGITICILAYVPYLWISKLLDKDASNYKTGRRFRTLGPVLTGLNPYWKVTTHVPFKVNDRNPYIFVGNHLSLADIPVISNLPWEMKWVGKKELFEIPIIGKMLEWAMDIKVDRQAADRLTSTLRQVKHHIDNHTSVMFFPEGTRSRSGKMNKFNDGAFAMAIRFGVPIVPIVVDGTEKALPKGKWLFDAKVDMHVYVLEPIDTSGYKKNQARELSQMVRSKMVEKLAEIRHLPIEKVDNTLKELKD